MGFSVRQMFAVHIIRWRSRKTTSAILLLHCCANHCYFSLLCCVSLGSNRNTLNHFKVPPGPPTVASSNCLSIPSLLFPLGMGSFVTLATKLLLRAPFSQLPANSIHLSTLGYFYFPLFLLFFFISLHFIVEFEKNNRKNGETARILVEIGGIVFTYFVPSIGTNDDLELERAKNCYYFNPSESHKVISSSSITPDHSNLFSTSPTTVSLAP